MTKEKHKHSETLCISDENLEESFSKLLKTEHLNNISVSSFLADKDYLIVKIGALMVTNSFFSLICSSEYNDKEAILINRYQLESGMKQMLAFCDHFIKQNKEKEKKNAH